MNNPYRVLGLTPDATDDEIKEAYRTLAKKYHPDNYVNNPLADLAEEKMKQLNEAYDQIQAKRAGRAGGRSGDGYTASRFAEIRAAMQSGRYADAEIMLDSVLQNDRDAEWNFLKGCVLLQRGWYTDAQKYLETACYMDPHNTEYRDTLSRVRQSAAEYGRTYRNQTGSSDNGMCDMCSTLICMDCLCECFGGDLISCC